MDKLSNSEDAKRFLRGLGLHIDEVVVRQVVNVLSGEAHQSLYSLFATRPDKPAPVCGKGSVYKIKKLYDEGELQPFLDYLSDSPTIGEAKAEQIKEAEHDVPKESRTEQVPYEETPHKQKMRELARKVATKVFLPIEFNSFIEERKPGFWFIGKGFPIIISEAGEVDVYPEYKEGHLYEGLFSHLRTGGFSDVLDKIIDWEQKAPKLLVASHELLNMIKKDIEKRHNVTLSIDDTVKTGFTPDFLITIYISAIIGMKEVDASSWYELRGLNLRRGAYWIYRGLPNEDLETYRDTHIELMGKYVVTDLAKHIGEQTRELRKIERNIKQRLERFVDMERLPGWCELCS